MNDTIKCGWCDTMFTPKSNRAKFCSEACKQKNKRKQALDTSLKDSGLPPTVQASKLPVPPKKEDAPFEAPLVVKEEICRHCGDIWPKVGYCLHNGPDYYIYGTFENPDQTWNRGCVLCGKDFETPLSLMRFCSEECKKDVMVVIANGPHKNFRL